MVTKENQGVTHRLELLGIGAAKDRELKANLLEALRQLDLDIPVEEVREIDRLLSYGISGIPALIVDGKVIFQKVVPSVDDIRIVLNVLLREEERQLPVRHIVVPTDFSETSDNAFHYALALAAFSGAHIKLVHIHQPKSERAGSVLLDGVPEELHYKQELLEAMSQLAPQQAKGANHHSVIVSPEMYSGSVIEELSALSRLKDTDLILMGTTGENRLLGRWLGSISSEVARKSHCPVMLVPKGARFKEFDQIIYASNYQLGEEHVLPKILDFACRFNATLHFVHIDAGKQNPDYDVRKIPIGPIVEESGVELRLSTVQSSDVLEGLNRYAKENGADLMVMGTVHRNFLEDLFRRHLTREMAFHTEIPLMVLHFNS